MLPKRPWLRWSLLVALLAALVVGFFFYLDYEGPVSRARFARLQSGMSREDVEGLLGWAESSEPEGHIYHHSHRPRCVAVWGKEIPWLGLNSWVTYKLCDNWWVWKGPRHDIHVYFDAGGLARSARLIKHPEAPSWWQRLRSRFSGDDGFRLGVDLLGPGDDLDL